MNRARRRGRTLSLRLWLVLTVVAVVVSATVAEIALSRSMGAWQQHADHARLAAVRAIIGTDAARWGAPAWQRQTEPALRALGVEAQLVRVAAGSSGQLVYTTAGARALLGVPVVGTTGTGTLATGVPQARSRTTWVGGLAQATAPLFQKIVIGETRAPPGGGRPVSGVAFLWLTGPAAGSPSPWLWPLAAGGAIFLVMVMVVWFLGRSVLRPLAAMNRAVEGIAGGDLDVRLPPSRAREVAAVGAALEGMSSALRASLERQSALEGQRQQGEEERKLFIGAIVHDLRTPLFMLRGYLKGLESGVAATPEKRAHYVAACWARIDALERLIADLFDYTRLEYLEQEPQSVPLELGDLLRESVEGVQPLAEARGIALALDGPEEPCLLAGDGQLLARVVGNLLDNALRHTPAGGQISVRWWHEEVALVFTVADNGPGIAAHDLPHLFTPLYRGETSRNRQTGGAGLGLTIARRIMQAHDGELAAANGARGGAIFTATLPVTLPAISPPARALTSGARS